MVLFCFSGKLGVEKTMRVVARLPTASFAFRSLVEDLPTQPGVCRHGLKDTGGLCEATEHLDM